MKAFLIRLLALWLCVAPVYADSSFVAPSATGQAATGQIPGTATNDNANSGNDGEYRSASTADTEGAQAAATITVTIASPAVVTWGTTIPYVFNGNGTAAVNFTTTGALPTGIVAGTNYYVISSSVSGNTFQIATSADNAIAGTAINTSGTQSGVQTGVPTALQTDNASVVLAALSLTSGDWDITNSTVFFAGASTAITNLSISNSLTTTHTLLPERFSQFQFPTGTVPGASNTSIRAGPSRFSLNGTTTVYALSKPRFTVSTLATWGSVRARRVR